VPAAEPDDYLVAVDREIVPKCHSLPARSEICECACANAMIESAAPIVEIDGVPIELPAYSRKETHVLQSPYVHILRQAQTSKNPPESGIFFWLLKVEKSSPTGRWNSTACVERRGKSSTTPRSFQSVNVDGDIPILLASHQPRGAASSLSCDCPNDANRAR